jgi:hypothetical protein
MFMNKFFAYIFMLIPLTTGAGGNSDKCDIMVDEVLELSNVLKLTGSYSDYQKLDSIISSPIDERCEFISSCTERYDFGNCIGSIRATILYSQEKIELGDTSWARYIGWLSNYTDGSVTEEIVASLSYMLPADPISLAEVSKENRSILNWLDGIVDPSPEFRNLDNQARCIRFSEIERSIDASMVADVPELNLIKVNARENKEYYSCP